MWHLAIAELYDRGKERDCIRKTKTEEEKFLVGGDFTNFHRFSTRVFLPILYIHVLPLVDPISFFISFHLLRLFIMSWHCCRWCEREKKLFPMHIAPFASRIKSFQIYFSARFFHPLLATNLSFSTSLDRKIYRNVTKEKAFELNWMSRWIVSSEN